MNARQIRDSKMCEELQDLGEDMDCLGCSCNVCIAQEPGNNYTSGIDHILKISESIKFDIELLEDSEEKDSLSHNINVLIYTIKQL